MIKQEAGLSGAVADGADQVSIESLFTLPFALHLRPLAHVSYLAEQDSNASSEQDEDAEGSGASSAGSNYKAGTHRLTPQTHAVAPHSLRTISMLLERTGCLDAVPAWSQLLEMLDAADDDPHFANLRAFFDARFDSAGRLISSTKDDAGLQRSASRRKRRPSHSQFSASPPNGDEPGRRPSVASGTAATNRFLLKRRKSSRRYEDDGGESSGRGGEDGNSGASRSLRAPEIIDAGRGVAEQRQVRFKVRLDLHAVGLAPNPPRPPPITRSSARSTIAKRLASSPPRRLMENIEVQRVASNTSSENSHSESLSLHPVASPDSFRSKVMSDDSDENQRGGSDALSTSPAPAMRTKKKKPSRTLTNSSAAAGSTYSDLGTSPDSCDVPRNRAGGMFGSFSKGDGIRRPSMIQRLMDFKGLRSASARSKESASNWSNQSVEELSVETGRLQQPIASGLTRAMSPASPTIAETEEILTNTSSIFSSGQMHRLRSHTEHSDMSNDEALDTADDEGSVSSSQHNGLLGKRRTSSSGGPLPSLGFKPAPGMRPVQEGSVISPISSDEDEHFANSSTSAGARRDLGNGGDFLSLLRKASNTSLTLRKTLRTTVASPARTPKGSTPASASQLPGTETPPDLVELEEQERVEAMLAPFKSGDAGSWWLSGSADPFPISIACALSQALGWNGIMDLCYGKNSRSERSGSYQPLGRAAEMDRKQQDEKTRVHSWAQGVAGNTSEAGEKGLAVDDTSEREARERLASLVLPKDAGSDAVAPSESASVLGDKKSEGGVNNVKKISNWLRKKSAQPSPGLQATEGTLADSISFQSPFEQSSTRTWQDWAELTRSIADWLQEYETTRVRYGLAGEVGHEVSSDVYATHPDSGFLETKSDTVKPRYASRASYQVPYCVVRDAISKHNSFRRRHGIPEGLPVGPDGEEIGDYRWARKRLSPNHFATSTMLAINSMSHYMQQIATSDWTHESAWELDYLEMCVFRSPVVARRFPSPGSSIVPSSQTFQPDADDSSSRKRAMPCPYPSAQGTWSSTAWLHWLQQIRNGMIIVPAVSWQAWWTLIAVLNGGDGTERALDVQLKAEEEPFSALDDLEAVYL